MAQRAAGDLMGLHFNSASCMLFALVQDGVLELVSKGAGKTASRYKLKLLEPA